MESSVMEKFYKTFDLTVESVEDVGTDERVVKGYASTWNRDLVNERFDRRAFDETIRDHFETPYNKSGCPDIKFAREHDIKYIIGRIDVLRADDKGLYFEAYISETIWGEDTYILLKDKAINKVSVGFSKLEEMETRDETVILKARLWEISIVGIPANFEAEVMEVKSMNFDELKAQVEDLQVTAKRLDEQAAAKAAPLEMVIRLVVESKHLADHKVEVKQLENEVEVTLTEVVQDAVEEKAVEETELVCMDEGVTDSPFTPAQLAYLTQRFKMMEDETVEDPMQETYTESVKADDQEVEIKAVEDKKEEDSQLDEIKQQIQNEFKSMAAMLNRERKNG